MRPRIGVIGAGFIGAFHGKAIHYCLKNGLIDGDFIGVCDTDAERRESYARAAGLGFVTDDPDEIIASPDVNTVYICTPTAYHRELAEKVAAAGKALFCEKPLAFNADDAAAMEEAVRRAGVTHQVGLVLRYSPIINVLREMIHDPSSGRSMTATMVDDQFFPIQGQYRSAWRGDASLVGAGTLLEHAIHDIDVLIYYFGRVKRVHGVTRNFAGKEGVEDVSNAILEFENGVTVSHVSIWHNILHRGSSRRMVATCENAQFSWEDDDWTGAIRTETNAAGARRDVASAEVVARYIDAQGIADERLQAAVTRYSLEDYAFLKAVSEERPAYPGFDVAVYAHRVVDAIYRSAREGAAVDLG